MKIKKITNLLLASVLFYNFAYIDLANAEDNNTISINQLTDFTQIYKNVSPSVVNISTSQELNSNVAQNGFTGDPFFDQFFGRIMPRQQNRIQRGLGSGFIISSDGYILTNAHVVANANKVIVKLTDQREFPAKIIGLDSKTDIALLKINANNLKPVVIGSVDKLNPGEWVSAIGSPFGLENTITHGIISAVSRNLPDETVVPFIQTDVPVNPGNSGGPLINTKSQVIGINSQIYSKSGGYMGISFAIPIDYAMRISNQIKTKGKVEHGVLGITIQPVTEEIAKSFGLNNLNGALINNISPNSPANRAGLQVGDIILKVNNQNITTTSSLSTLINNLGPNQPISLTVWRDKQPLVLHAITGSDEVPTNQIKVNGSMILDKLGVGVTEAKANQLQVFAQRVKYALIINNINQTAMQSGLRSGDYIIGIANAPLMSFNQLDKILKTAKANQSIVLKIARINDNQIIYAFIPVLIQK